MLRINYILPQQLARQLENHADIADPLSRSSTQSRALRTGVMFYNLGAYLLELGRTTMTLRLGQTPVDLVSLPWLLIPICYLCDTN